MADRFDRHVAYGATGAGVAIDEGLRSYMQRVYNYMAVALVETGLIAYGVATWLASQGPEMIQKVYGSPLMWVVMLAPLGIVFYLSARINRMAFSSAQTWFWVFAGVMGLSLSTIFFVYTGASIAKVFFITAASFGALSLYGYTTKRDISGWGSFLFIGLIGIIIASIVNIFLGSGMLSFMISVIGVLVFAGLTAYDTQRIKEMYMVSDSGEVAGKKAIMGALALYLDFINLFLMLLRLFGNRN
jgi:uncharacterized protein